MEANQMFRGTAFEAALLFKPPALRGVSNYSLVSPAHIIAQHASSENYAARGSC